jgi:foldase protein PrsA
VQGRPLFTRALTLCLLVAMLAVSLPIAQAQDTAVLQPIPTLPVDPLSGQQMVALVNEVPISIDAFQRTLTRTEQQQGLTITLEDAEAFQRSVLEMMITQELINQAAEAQQLVLTDAELDAELARSMELAGSAELWQQWLNANFYTQDEFRQTLRDALITGLVRDAVMADMGEQVPYINARHILVTTQEEADAILQQLMNGQDFVALAAVYSRDETTRINGGDLGWFAEGELLDPIVSRTAFSLEPGMIAGPIQSSLGYHIIQTIARETRTVDDATRALLAQSRFELWLGEQFIAATIERFL